MMGPQEFSKHLAGKVVSHVSRIEELDPSTVSDLLSIFKQNRPSIDIGAADGGTAVVYFTDGSMLIASSSEWGSLEFVDKTRAAGAGGDGSG